MKLGTPARQPQQPSFAFCETATAGPLTPEHIRHLDDAGLKVGGGVTTPSLCGQDLRGGWDIDRSVDSETVALLSTPRTSDGRVFLCTGCSAAWETATS